jgi:DNA-binding MarR family transcriptional regulator
MEKAGPRSSPGFHLWTASLRWTQAIGRALAPVGLTHTQFFVLGAARWLGRDGAAPNQRQVADLAGTDPMVTSQVVRALERRGLLRRRDDPDDARSWRLELSAEGERTFQAAVALVREVDAAFFRPVRGRQARFIEELEALAAR